MFSIFILWDFIRRNTILIQFHTRADKFPHT